MLHLATAKLTKSSMTIHQSTLQFTKTFPKSVFQFLKATASLSRSVRVDQAERVYTRALSESKPGRVTPREDQSTIHP